ncbi:MAG TPA: hypothetical protein VM597_36975 [Gemmataceae bacterium]|nr:hypothetical protein [Gemmataceae bacterium]
MSNPADPDLVKVTEVFLIPSSFIVAALGTADTNPHRACVSLVGLVISVLWWACSREALAERGPPAAGSPLSRRVRVMSWLPVFFSAVWVVSLAVHVALWDRPLGH